MAPSTTPHDPSDGTNRPLDPLDAAPSRSAPSSPRGLALPTSLVDGLVSHFAGPEALEALPEPERLRLLERLRESGLVGGELVLLWQLLARGLARAGYRPPVDRELRILDLACGRCAEAALLAAFFGRPAGPGRPATPIRFFALDLRDAEIDRARRRYAATEALFRGLGLPSVAETSDSPAPEMEFVADDALHLPGYGQIPRVFDVVFIRHQNVWNDRPVWRRIFTFALERLADEGGVLVITSYFDREHLIALELLRELGGRVLATEANPRREELDYPGKSCDRHLAVLRRRSTGEPPPSPPDAHGLIIGTGT